MNTIHNFAFVQTDDAEKLEGTIILVNRSRHHRLAYSRIIQTAPRRGWIALIIDSNSPDHYLFRNLSGRLDTTSFEFGRNGMQLYYRLHHKGRTIRSRLKSRRNRLDLSV